MIELTNAQGFILSFDGRVLEFFQREATRMHGCQVKKVEVKEKKGSYTVQVTSDFGLIITMMKLDQSQRAPIDQLLAALNAARPGEIEFKQ